MARNDGNSVLKKLGKHKESGGCLYINKLSDVNTSLLPELIEKSFLYTKKLYKVK